MIGCGDNASKREKEHFGIRIGSCSGRPGEWTRPWNDICGYDASDITSPGIQYVWRSPRNEEKEKVCRTGPAERRASQSAPVEMARVQE